MEEKGINKLIGYVKESWQNLTKPAKDPFEAIHGIDNHPKDGNANTSEFLEHTRQRIKNARNLAETPDLIPLLGECRNLSHDNKHNTPELDKVVTKFQEASNPWNQLITYYKAGVKVDFSDMSKDKICEVLEEPSKQISKLPPIPPKQTKIE